MTGDAAKIVELTGITKTIGDTAILGGVDLAIDAGESIAIVGPSGCGKTTLLNIIGTLDQPTAGKVVLDGNDAASLDEDALAALRSSKVGFVFQLHHLLPQLSVLENALVPTLVAAEGREDAEKRARELLERVGLGHRLDHRPGELSGGECQRASVVRALINRPRLLLADEPTGSLDRAGAEALAKLLFELNAEQGVALVMVTHASELAAQAGRVLELRDGKLD